MKKIIVCLFALLGVAQGVWATDYITDVVLVSSNDYDVVSAYKDAYRNDGWTSIDYDLNRGAGGAFVYLLYKTTSSPGSSNEVITDFYIKLSSSSDHPDQLTHNGRTYYLTPGGGNDDFNRHGRDLNQGAGGKYIYLYYTKDDFPFPNQAVTSITINGTKDGAVGENGGSNGCDLNNGAKGNYIYMHVTTAPTETTPTVSTTYIGADGTSHEVTATVIHRLHQDLSTGWYLMRGNVANYFRMNVKGDVNIILANRATMDNPKGITVEGNNRLTFWAQSTDQRAGEWNISSPDEDHAGIGSSEALTNSGYITINGGKITTQGGKYAAGIGAGISNLCHVTINGGTVNATGGEDGAGIGGGYFSVEENKRGDVSITGGTVTATGGSYAAGIGGGVAAECKVTITGGTIKAYGGANAPGIGDGGFISIPLIKSYRDSPITLSYTDDVSIYSTGYKGTVTLSKNFFDSDGNYYATGKMRNRSLPFDINDQPINALPISGKTLVPAYTFELADNDDNSTMLNTYNGKRCIVTLADRTLTKDGSWNTLCLPFSLKNFSGTPLAGTIVKELDIRGTSLSDEGLLTLTFSDPKTSIEAGKPYIVKWDTFLEINSADDWNSFARNVSNGTEPCEGRIVKLTADIDISIPVGTNAHPFMGIFDGQGHTLNCSITDEKNQGTAPFRYIYGATIQNVKTTGFIKGTQHCAGLVGIAKTAKDNSTNNTLMVNTISNCEVAATITCGGTTHTHCGGILGHATKTQTTIKDCLFSGSVSGATTHLGIIYGWGDTGKHTIINCLANGTYSGNGIDLIKSGDTRTITNCYKTENIGSRGTYTTATGSKLANMLGSGWEVRDGKVVPKTNAIVSNVVNPVFNGVTIKNDAPEEMESSDGNVKFVGHYSPFVIDASNKNEILFVSTDNRIGYVLSDASLPRLLKNFRAHFQAKPDGNGAAGVRAIRINWDDDETTSIENVQGSMPAVQSESWYTLDGRRLNGMPTQPGVYIHGVKKVVIK